MVIVDTSVWIALFRGGPSSLGETARRLVEGNLAAVCGQVYVEYIGGFRDKTTRSLFAGLMDKYPFVETSRDAHRLAADLLAEFPKLGAGDAVIAATAIHSDSFLFTLDKDFNPVVARGLKLFGNT